MGTVRLLVEVHRRGLAVRTIDEDLGSLRRAGFRITDELEAWAIEQCRASDEASRNEAGGGLRPAPGGKR
jgi:hypothetical protein